MTLRIRPNAIEQDHGPFTFPGATITGDLNVDGDLNFQGTQIITTTAGDLVLTPNEDVHITKQLGIGISPAADLHIYLDNADTAASLIFDQDGSGDASARFTLLGVQSYIYGIDNTDNFFKINRGTSLGASVDFVLDTSGRFGIGTGVPTFVEGSGIHIADATAPVLRLQDSSQVNSDWEIRSPSAGNRLEFFHVNTAKVQLSLSSAGKFGIHPGGYVAPDGTLHVHTATAGAVTAHANADDLVIENSTFGGISILTPANRAGSIFFGDTGSEVAGAIQYDHGLTQFRIYVETAEVAKITASSLDFQQATSITTTAGDLTLNPAVDINISKVLNFDWGMGDSTKDPTTDAPDDWVQVEIGNSVYYLPAYVAS